MPWNETADNLGRRISGYDPDMEGHFELGCTDNALWFLNLTRNIPSVSNPGPGNRAFVVIAAPGAGKRIVVDSVYAALEGLISATTATFQVLEATTEVFAQFLKAPAVSIDKIEAGNINMSIAENTAVTVGFSAAVSGARQTVSVLHRIVPVPPA